MIKSVTLKKFESHVDTTLDFSDGLCLIEGLSNSGKSAIIRSMAVVVDNRWEKEMVRVGEQSCLVRMETERGWVECERGEKINRWRCYDDDLGLQEYKSVGVGVPEQATKILGMGRKNRGDIKELPNFQFQLEKHYMLSEIDGKKVTSNVIARMMDNAIGLGGLEDFIKALSTDVARDKKWLGERQNEINELKSEVIDEVVFDEYHRMVWELLASQAEMNDLSSGIDDAKKLYQELLIRKSELARQDKVVESYAELDRLIELAGQIEQIDGQLKLVRELQALNEELNKMTAVADVDLTELDTLLKEMDGLHNRIDRANELLRDARRLWKDGQDCKKEVDKLSKTLVILNSDLNELKNELGVCPLCEREF